MLKSQRQKLKAQIIETGLDKEVAKASRQNFVNHDRSTLDELEFLYGKEIIKTAKSINHSNYKRRERIKDRVGFSVSTGYSIFLTLTFTDEVLNSTTKETRRKYVSRFLKAHCLYYVANIDYGSQHEREHYHALVFASSVDYSKWHKYGSIFGERVNKSRTDEEKVAKYVAKLTNHALKESCGVAPRLIYSRGLKNYKIFFHDSPF